jgi:hypothetical protein
MSIYNACNAVFPVAIAALLLIVTKLQAFRQRRALAFLPWFYFAMFVAYTGYVLGPWFFHRYFHPFVYGYVLLVFLSLDRVLDLASAESSRWMNAKPKLVSAAFVGCLALTAAFAISMVRDLRMASTRHSYYVASEVAKRILPKDAVVGFFQSGILGYNWDRPFIGLDGKVNEEALAALRKHEIDRYIASTKMDYLIDDLGILKTMLEGYSTKPGFMSRHPVEGPVATCYLLHLRK